MEEYYQQLEHLHIRREDRSGLLGYAIGVNEVEHHHRMHGIDTVKSWLESAARRVAGRFRKLPTSHGTFAQ